VRLPANGQSHAERSHRLRARENGHRAGLGFHRASDVDRGRTKDAGPVTGQPSVVRHRGDGCRAGGRDGGYVTGRGGLAVAEDQTRHERDQGDKAHAAVLRRRT